MEANALKVVKIGIVSILIVLGTLSKGRDLRFVDVTYNKYVVEFIEELEEEGIDIPNQIRWTIGEDISLFRTSILGWALGMNDDRQVNIRMHPLNKFKSEDEIRFILWHELAHDIFNIKHDTMLLMKTTSSKTDAYIFPAAKIEFIQYLKNNR